MKLGHQLEKDYAQQLQYEGCKGIKPSVMPPRSNSGQSVEKPQVHCWQCKGYHLPGNFPHFIPAPSNQPSVQHRPTSNNCSFQPLKSGGPPRQPTTPSSNIVSAAGSLLILE